MGATGLLLSSFFVGLCVRELKVLLFVARLTKTQGKAFWGPLYVGELFHPFNSISLSLHSFFLLCLLWLFSTTFFLSLSFFFLSLSFPFVLVFFG